MANMIGGFVRYLPDAARIDDEEIEMDGEWTAERIMTRMPIEPG